MVSLRYVYVPFTYILCQSNWHVYILTNFQNVNKPSTLHSYLQKQFLASKNSLDSGLNQCNGPSLAIRMHTNNFSWDAAKASHAVLLCRMEQGEVVSYQEIDKIDRIRRANAQRHIPQSQYSAHSLNNVRKNANKITKSHETKGTLF